MTFEEKKTFGKDFHRNTFQKGERIALVFTHNPCSFAHLAQSTGGVNQPWKRFTSINSTDENSMARKWGKMEGFRDHTGRVLPPSSHIKYWKSLLKKIDPVVSKGDDFREDIPS